MLNIKRGSKIKSETPGDYGILQHLVESTWKPLLKAIKLILPKSISETFTQQILGAVQSWIISTGTLQNLKARDSYLRVLCNSCVPRDNSNELSSKHIQSTKILFNIAHCLGGNI